MRALAARCWRRVRGSPRTSLAGAALLALLLLLHLDAVEIRAWAEWWSAIGELASALTSTVGTLAALAGALGLLAYHRETR